MADYDGVVSDIEKGDEHYAILLASVSDIEKSDSNDLGYTIKPSVVVVESKNRTIPVLYRNSP
jgi:hypothetical protein